MTPEQLLNLKLDGNLTLRDFLGYRVRKSNAFTILKLRSLSGNTRD